jgi:hypothetical protein
LNESGSLTSILGVEVSEQQQRDVLDLHRTMAGGTLRALTLALPGDVVGVNLGGGFHHAATESAHGFCVFNDIAMAVRGARERGLRSPILVIDLDLHDGDGTRRIFANDASVHTFSIHNQDLDAFPAVASTSLALGGGVEDGAYLSVLKSVLPGVVDRVDPGLCIYVAGVDGAADDRIGNWRLSQDAMLVRDLLVYSLVRRRRKIPLLVVLAGGYGGGAWRYPARFLAWMMSGLVLDPPSPEEMMLVRMRVLRDLLDPRELTGGSDNLNDLGLTEADLLGTGPSSGRTPRFLDYYTVHGIELAIEKYGLTANLRALGYPGPAVSFQRMQDDTNVLRIHGEQERKNLLIELQLRHDRSSIPGMDLLSLDWMLLQNPRASFSDARPRLPGQTHPGLGLLGMVFGILVMMCERLRMDGIIFIPTHFHVAAVTMKHLCFLHWDNQDNFDAIRRASTGMPLSKATQALEDGLLQHPTSGDTLVWKAGPMVYPTSENMFQFLLKRGA